jgi:hypothetical protein
MDQDFDPVAASGESTYRAPRALELNELLINGDADVEETAPGQFIRKGGNFRKRILVGKARDQRPEEEKLGDRVQVIFLKVRRKLVQRGDLGKILYSTNEHNTANEVVDLFGENGFIESGSAKALRERYPGLRTIQVVYALFLDGAKEPELVRITIKGASLGSDAKTPDANSFYQYLSSYAREDHWWEYVTELSAILEKGQKSYFCMDFARGQKLDEKFQALALEKMKEVHFRIVEIDEARKAKRAANTDRVVVAEDDTDMPARDPALDEDGGADRGSPPNPDDIPF